MTTRRDRAIEFASTAARSSEAYARLLEEFAEAEVAIALQPRAAAPELARAELWLSSFATEDTESRKFSKVIAAELSRLRAENARQAEELAAVALMRRAVSRTMEVTTDGDLCLPRWGKHTEFLAAVRSFMEMTDATARRCGEGGKP